MALKYNMYFYTYAVFAVTTTILHKLQYYIFLSLTANGLQNWNNNYYYLHIQAQTYLDSNGSTDSQLAFIHFVKFSSFFFKSFRGSLDTRHSLHVSNIPCLAFWKPLTVTVPGSRWLGVVMPAPLSQPVVSASSTIPVSVSRDGRHNTTDPIYIYHNWYKLV